MKKFLFLIIMLMILCLTGCYNYRGWKKVKIPTDGLLQGTVKVPNNCEFVLENETIKLVNNDSKEVYAEQISVGYKNFSHYVNSSEKYEHKIFPSQCDVVFNEKLIYDFENADNYTYIKGYSNAVYKYDFMNQYTVLDIAVYYTKDYGDYYLTLLIYDSFDEEMLEQFIASYTFGGTVGYENDVEYN